MTSCLSYVQASNLTLHAHAIAYNITAITNCLSASYMASLYYVPMKQGFGKLMIIYITCWSDSICSHVCHHMYINLYLLSKALIVLCPSLKNTHSITHTTLLSKLSSTRSYRGIFQVDKGSIPVMSGINSFSRP